MCHRGTGEALVGRRLRVDAQGHLTTHQLIHDELVELLPHLVRGRELPLPVVLERLHGRGLQVRRVAAHGHRARLARRLAAPAHARVEPEPALVQVGVSQGVNHADPLILSVKTKRKNARQ